MFWNSFFLQNVAGDLPSAVKGFDSLATARRGNPWKRENAVAADAKILANMGRACQMVKGGVGGDGDGGICGGGGGHDGVPDILEAFLEPYEGVVREFTSQAASKYAVATSAVSRL